MEDSQQDEPSDEEPKLDGAFWEKVEDLPAYDLLEPFEPDENKLREWNMLLASVDPETDRVK